MLIYYNIGVIVYSFNVYLKHETRTQYPSITIVWYHDFTYLYFYNHNTIKPTLYKAQQECFEEWYY